MTTRSHSEVIFRVDASKACGGKTVMVYLSLVTSCSYCSLCVYFNSNNGFYCYPFSVPSIKNKISEKNTVRRTQSLPFILGVLVGVLSLTCSFNLFIAVIFCENTRGKMPENEH